jgi:hypothetical protein
LIATIASIGVHGVLLFMAPSLPQGQQAKAEGPKTVNVVQLTPEEQKRLPNFSKSIPPLSNPLVAGNPSLYSNPIGLPNPSSLPPLPPVGNPGSLPPLPDPTQLWGQVKPPTSFSIPAPPSDTSFPQIPTRSPQVPPPIPPQKVTPKGLPTVNPADPKEPEQPPESSPNPTPSLPSAAEVQQKRDEENARSNPPPIASGQIRSIVGTTDDEQRNRAVALSTRMLQENRPLGNEDRSETLPFPDGFCPKDALKAVVVNTVNLDGTIAYSTETLSSGYGQLNQVAVQALTSKRYEPNKTISTYTHTITFVEPEGGCKPAPIVTPTASPAEPPSPAPSATSSATPTDSPSPK